MRTLKRIVLAAAAVAAATSAQAETNWDLPLAWPPGNLHVENAQAFADAVKEGTNGELVITQHHGGALGFKGPEMLRAVQYGLVPLGDILLNQPVGDEALSGIESVTDPAAGYDDIAKLTDFSSQVYEGTENKRKPKISR